MKLMGEGRRIIGDVGDGRASVTVTDYQGNINFLRRCVTQTVVCDCTS